MSVSNENKELLCYTCEVKLLDHENIIDGVVEFGYLVCSECYDKFCCCECGSGHSKLAEDFYCKDCSSEFKYQVRKITDENTEFMEDENGVWDFNDLEDAEKLYNKIIADDPDDLWLELTKSDGDDDYEVLQEYKNIEEESSDDDSSVHSDHSIAVDEVIKLLHSAPCPLECDIHSGCGLDAMTIEELETHKIEILIEIERHKLLNEFYRLEKMSPKAMIELNKKYDKNITEYTNEEIRDIILEILNYNMDNYEN